MQEVKSKFKCKMNEKDEKYYFEDKILTLKCRGCLNIRIKADINMKTADNLISAVIVKGA